MSSIEPLKSECVTAVKFAKISFVYVLGEDWHHDVHLSSGRIICLSQVDEKTHTIGLEHLREL